MWKHWNSLGITETLYFQNHVHRQTNVSKCKDAITTLKKLIWHGKMLRITANPNPCVYLSHEHQVFSEKFTKPLSHWEVITIGSGWASLTCQKKMDFIAMRVIRKMWLMECGPLVFQMTLIAIVSQLQMLLYGGIHIVRSTASNPFAKKFKLVIIWIHTNKVHILVFRI